MTWIDAAIAVIFLYFVITAFQAGFIREIIGMAAAVLGAVLAGLFYGNVADTLLSSIDNTTTASVAAFLIIFIGISLAGQLLAMLVHPAVTILQLGILDQLLGAALGAVKGFLIIEVLLVLFVTYPRYHMDQRINDSAFASKMVNVSAPVLKILPDVFQKKVDAFKG
ncbi:MAG TPA: CvpA family protein [Dehalococcoidia bacterium]|nr:CvpA family protein [Dehalococcoidia bacterium]